MGMIRPSIERNTLILPFSYTDEHRSCVLHCGRGFAESRRIWLWLRPGRCAGSSRMMAASGLAAFDIARRSGGRKKWFPALHTSGPGQNLMIVPPANVTTKWLKDLAPVLRPGSTGTNYFTHGWAGKPISGDFRKWATLVHRFSFVIFTLRGSGRVALRFPGRTTLQASLGRWGLGRRKFQFWPLRELVYFSDGPQASPRPLLSG